MQASLIVLDRKTAGVINSALLGLGLFGFCLFGIFTRPGADLASFWPANAFMLGMLVRFPSLANPLSWLCCAVGFAAADLLTGSTILNTVVLNLGNLTAISAGYIVFQRLDPAERQLARPASVLFMLVAVGAAAITAGVIGTVADPLLFGGSPFDALLFWSATEMVNYVAFLPMILTLPDEPLRRLRRIANAPLDIMKFLPLLALAGTAIAGALVGGPGAIAFPVLALLWCAVTYSLFTTACLAFAFVAWTLLAIATGYLPVADNTADRATLLSIRFAVSLTGVAPLVVASVMAAREELLQRLMFLSNHDQMTGLFNRSAFLENATQRLRADRYHDFATFVLMLDIDHFKAINDQYGHAAGDRVIIAFADLLKRKVRKGDIVGRMGGEEFAVILSECTAEEAEAIATRINTVFAATPVCLEDGTAISATVSIGMVTATAPSMAIEPLLAMADEALYAAKRQGRNRVVTPHQA